MIERARSEQEHDQEVYAAAGLALRWAQMFEAELVNALFLHGVARGKFTKRDEAKEFIYKSDKKPLRQKLDAVLKRIQFEPDLRPTFDEALSKRNIFVHQYFWERTEAQMSEAGRDRMISELKELARVFYSAHSFTQMITELYAKQVGLTDKMI
ncbi:MAG: hypothetical protein MN733_27705 [Nitrososphaera sp.]|nr:hypothetical protein [Nitrososphaera sp.]